MTRIKNFVQKVHNYTLMQKFIENIDYQLVTQIFFFLFGLITIGGALFLLFTKNVLYAAFSLLLTFLGVAGLYVFAGADFLAVSQIMIYVGGILVLLIFGVMLTRKKEENRQANKPNQIFVTHHNQNWAIGLAVVLVAGFIKAIFDANFHIIRQISPPKTTVNKIGMNLITNNVFIFELIGILLLVALIGASFIAYKEEKPS
jgi:NADH-quinone oxidoreductase subunit J